MLIEVGFIKGVHYKNDFKSSTTTRTVTLGYSYNKTQFEVEVTVLYSVTVNARNEEEAMNLMYDIDFDSVSQPDGITYLSSTVDRVDI